MEKLKELISILNSQLSKNSNYKLYYSKTKTTRKSKHTTVVKCRIRIYAQYLMTEHKETILLIEGNDEKQLIQDAYENLIFNIAFSKANYTFECKHGELVRSFRDITQTF